MACPGVWRRNNLPHKFFRVGHEEDGDPADNPTKADVFGKTASDLGQRSTVKSHQNVVKF
ncbi:hypothetical protein DYGSA30_07330 [Dyella sp. GSA-30]|nr:hypothetical protein DYGSA30_07330 [Dyella sp. GSA-30]